jgi:hypothetical protein
MNAFQAQQLVTEDYQKHIDYAYTIISQRSQQGFYSVTIKDGIWCIDSDLTRTVCRKLEGEGYMTYLTSDKGTGLTYTKIKW